jgi:hypothetical protein
MGAAIRSMPEPIIPQKLRLAAAIAIALGLGFCALALVAQAVQPDEIGSLIPASAFFA